MYINQHLQKKVATGLMILFLVFALVPIYIIMAKFATGGHYVQLCTAAGMQTVWVADEAGANAGSGATVQSGIKASDGSLVSPFGCCEFCWTSVLAATVLPLLSVFCGCYARAVRHPCLSGTYFSILSKTMACQSACPSLFIFILSTLSHPVDSCALVIECHAYAQGY